MLSGGEKIRLCFARIFVNPPNLLVLDEPTTHLDIRARELLQTAIRQYPGTVCVVSHDIEFVRQVATTIVAMEEEGPRKYFGGSDYYLEKSQALRQIAVEETPRRESAGDLAKERRRERARRRAALSGEKRRAEKAVADLEARLETLEKHQAELVSLLSGEGKVDFAELNRELASVQQAMEQTMTEWEKAASELEEILRENARIHEDQ